MKKTNKLLAILLAAFMMAVVAPMAFAADEVVTIDLANGNVIITETGYSIDGGAETAFTGDYVITGKNDETKMANVIQINSVAENTDITLKDVEIAQKGPACVYSLVDLTLEATGSVKMSNIAPTIQSNGKKIEIKGDADISVTTGVYFAHVYQGTIEIACKSLDVTGTGSAPVIYECTDFKVNAQEDVVINGWTFANNTDIVAGGDIFAGNGKTTSAVFNGTASLKSINGDITIDHKGMICSGNAIDLEAAGDVTVNADTPNPAIAAGTLTITGDNVTLTNASGMLTSVSTTDIDAKGDITIEGNRTGSPVVTGSVAYLNADGNITLTNNASGGGMLSTVTTMDIDAKGDITLTAECSSPMMYTNITAKSENGTVAMTNKGNFFITSGNLVVDAEDIVLTVVGAGPITPYGYDLTAENNITVSTANATTTYDPAAPTAYDFGNKLTVTTSEGTTEHTHEFADVAYNNDATCTADGTKLVKCDCEWAKEKTVTAEGTKLDHVDADGDYLCDNACGYEFEKPVADTCPDCGSPAHGDGLIEKIICWFNMLINLIKSIFA